ncbi:putative ABC transport system permease protein [Nocardiopsis sp. Huas11]|uniref:FtsX-like permease family protein n=1 Tax=Nocardiopsis sp. Huas11 TaxID=2183912 RepID=UPI000EB33F92|nr:ABC transporter permease [Nocardiopsis sp. Huas11]RKS05065.1 putative ABC transport system permease protein [Nocardiopsis sp. Huas11]
MIALVLRGAAERAGALAVSVLTVALGAGLAVAALSLQAAADRVADEGTGAAWRLEGAPVVVVARPDRVEPTTTPSGEPPRLDPATVAALGEVPGVDALTPAAPFPAYVVTGERTFGDQRYRSWGHSWDLAETERLTLERGRPPRSEGEVVLDSRTAAEAGVAPGDRTRVLTAEGMADAVVTGVVGAGTGEAGTGGGRDRAVFFAPEAAAAAGGDAVLAAVRPVEGTDPDALAEVIGAELPQVRVLTGAARSEALQVDRTERELASGMGRVLGTVSGLLLALAAVMVANQSAMTVRRRAREFALLRLIGAAPGQVRRLVAGEALILGCVAAVLACATGAVLTVALAAFFDAMGGLPDGFDPGLEPSAAVTGAVLALAVPVLAGWSAVRGAGRTAPIEAVRTAQVPDTAPSRARAAAGVLSLGVAAAALAASWAMAGSQGAVVAAFTAAPVLVLAGALLAPALCAGAPALLRPLTRRGAVAFLTVGEARAHTRRVAGVLTPLAVTMGIACLLLFQGATVSRAQAHSYGERLAADLVVSGAEGVGLPESAVDAARAVPGVAAVGGFRQTVTFGSGATLPTHLVDPATVPDLYRLEAVRGAWTDFDAGGVAVNAATAQREGWRHGDDITLTGPDGDPVPARVAVLYRAGLDFPEVLLPRADLAPRMLDAMDAAVYVALEPGADPADVARHLEREVDAGPALLVADRAGHVAAMADRAEEDGWITTFMVALVAGFAGIAAVNTLVVSVAARSRTFALLRLVGASRRQVVGVVVAEALTVSLAGVVLGGVAALVGLAAVGHALTGDTVVPAVPMGGFLGVAATVVALGLVASLVPMIAALRARPLRAAADG